MNYKTAILTHILLVSYPKSENYDWVNSLPKPWSLTKTEFDYYFSLSLILSIRPY